MYPQLIQDFLAAEALPDSYRQDAETWFQPYIAELDSAVAQAAGCLLLGINGAQGTGKSTLSKLITALLSAQGRRVANLSIDDFYLGKRARQALAESRHPLLATRGVPGTHDSARLRTTLQQLRTAAAGDVIILPKFDKASDDSCPPQDFARLEGPIDLIILEGWFVGVQPQPAAALATAVNALEAEEDADGSWRGFVNQALAADYVPIFQTLDRLLMLQAPSFEQVYAWRGLQEEKLRASNGQGAGVMSPAQLQRFIQHYERLSRHCLQSLPQSANTRFLLDADHRVVSRHDNP